MTTTNTVPQAVFGPGILWLTRTDIANQTPFNIGYINEFTVDMTFETKQLFGQKSFPLVAARGTAKATGKMIAATLSGQALNTVLLGGSWTAGKQYDATTVTGTIAGGVVTPAIPSGTFNKDLGVVYAASGEPLVYSSSTAPASGHYHVASTGPTYHFSTLENGSSVKASFAYASTVAQTGQSQTINNPDIGTTPTFQIDYKSTLYGSTYFIRIFNAIGSKTAFGHKLSDFMMPEYDFEFYANSSQQLGIISLATQA